MSNVHSTSPNHPGRKSRTPVRKLSHQLAISPSVKTAALTKNSGTGVMIGGVSRRGNMAQIPQKTPTASEIQTRPDAREAVSARPVAHHPTITESSACQDKPVIEMLTGNGA